MTDPQNPPVFLNLLQIRLPVGAVASIAHRISGLLLFLSLPFLAWMLELSLQGPEGYTQAVELLQSAWLRLGSVLLAWSLLHHLLAGLRFLMLDLHLGLDLPVARLTAWLVNLGAAVLALLYLWWVL